MGQNSGPATQVNGGVLLAAKATPHVDLTDPYPVYGHPKHCGNIAPHCKRCLHGPLYQHGSIRLGNSKRDVGFQIGVFQERNLIGSLHNHFRFIEAFFYIAFAKFVAREQISLFVNLGRVRLQRVARIKNCW